VESEPIDEFEKELRQAFERRPAPPSLKRRVMQQRNARRSQKLQIHSAMWQRIAASLLVACVLGGGYALRQVEERRKGEEARRQVLTAFRITSHALNQMNARLIAHDQQDHQ
jgi:hypothetical protein